MESQELTKAKIRELVKREDPLILEVGCYDGKDSSELNKLFFDATFICFEADPRSYKLFKEQNHPTNIVIQLTALGNRDGGAELFMSTSDTRRHGHNPNSWSASSSLRKPKTHLELFPDVQFPGSIGVNCRKLDSVYIEKLGDNVIDFIWVDINGAEEDFILGGIATLKYKTKYLYIEFSDKELYEGQITKEGILNLLPEFKLEGIYNFAGNFGNLLLKNKNL